MSSQSLPSTFQSIESKSYEAIDCDGMQDDTQWMESLSRRENILYGDPPFMPILIENIPNYVKLDDFELDRIKEIQTAGIVFGKEWEEIAIYNCDQDNLISIKLSLACIKRESLKQKGFTPGVKFPCKLFGRLYSFEEKPLLEIYHLLKTNDLQGSVKTTAMLSKVVRQKYHYYVCSQNP